MSNILLIQSDPTAAARTRQALAGSAGLEIASVAATLAEAHKHLDRETPALALADLRMADGLANELFDRIGSGRSARTLGVAIAPSPGDPLLIDAIRHGACGYVISAALSETLAQTLQQVLAGESPMSPEIARAVKAYFDSQAWDSTDFVGETQSPMHLSDTERQTLDWIIEGRPLQEVASGLQTTPHLLGVQIRSLYLRMQFGLRADSLSLGLS